MSIPLLLGSLIAILAVAALVRGMGLGANKLADVAQAKRIAGDALTGFRAIDVLLSADGRAALVTGENRDYALIKQHGANFAVRHLFPPLRIERDGAVCTVLTGEARFGNVRLLLSQQDADRLLTMM